MRIICQTALLLLVVAVPVVAQDQLATPITTASECTQELFENAEQSFSMRRRGTEVLHKAERQLKEVVRLCQERPGIYQAEQHLKVAQEELADSNLFIAVSYLNKFKDGKGGSSGALSRLRAIVERYPHYSKLDRVLSLLGQLNVAEGNLDEATTYYTKIIREYPASEYFGEATVQLSVIDVLRTNSCIKSIP